MALKAILETLDGVPEALHEFYVQKDGKYVLDAEGVEDVKGLKSALQREKAERKKRADELASLKEALGDIEPEKAREALAKVQEYEDKKLLDAGQIEELVAQRTERAKADALARVKAIEAAAKQTADEKARIEARLSEVMIDNAIRTEATRAYVRDGAVDDVLLRGKQLFKLVDGEVRAVKGEAIEYGKDGNPLTIGEWLNGLVPAAPHLFESSNGGGAPGSGHRPGTGVRVVANNPNAIGANLEAVATGKAIVQ